MGGGGWRTALAGFILPKDISESIGMLTSVVGGSSAPRRGTAELMNAYKASPWLRGVVSKIGFHFASVPWRLYGTKGSGSKQFVRDQALQSAGFEDRKKIMREMRKAGELVEITTHPLLDLLNKPNPKMSGLAVRKVSQAHLDLKGEAFWLLETNGLGKPAEAWPLPPHWVTTLPTSKEPTFEVSIRGKRQNIPQEQMLWVRDLDPSDPFGRGTGVGEALMDEIDTDEYAAKVVKNFFWNKARPDMMIALKGAKPETLQRAQAEFEQKFRGYHNAHRVMWTSGDLTIKELQQKFTDMELLDLRAWERDAFINVFGVPPEIVGLLANSNRATIREALAILGITVLIPRLELWRLEMQMQLVPMFDNRAVLDYDSPVPDDDDYKLKVMQAAPWAFTVREWRSIGDAEDRGDIDNIHMMPFNLVPVPPGGSPLDAGKMLAARMPELMINSPHSWELPPAAGPTQPRQVLPALTKDDDDFLDRIVDALKPERLTTQLDPVWEERVREWGDDMLDELGVDVAFNMLNPLVTEFLENFAAVKIVGVNNTTKKLVRETLAEGVRAGEDVRKLAKRIEEVMADASRRRAVSIARTEVVGSSNRAIYSAFDQSGVVHWKGWAATPDGRTRDEHAMLDGTEIPLALKFEIGGSTAMQPGDFGVAHLDINCRCVIYAVTDVPKTVEDRLAIWKGYDSRLTGWEQDAIRALRVGFNLQLEDAIARLDSLLA